MNDRHITNPSLSESQTQWLSQEIARLKTLTISDLKDHYLDLVVEFIYQVGKLGSNPIPLTQGLALLSTKLNEWYGQQSDEGRVEVATSLQRVILI